MTTCIPEIRLTSARGHSISGRIIIQFQLVTGRRRLQLALLLLLWQPEWQLHS